MSDFKLHLGQEFDAGGEKLRVYRESDIATLQRERDEIERRMGLEYPVLVSELRFQVAVLTKERDEARAERDASNRGNERMAKRALKHAAAITRLSAALKVAKEGLVEIKTGIDPFPGRLAATTLAAIEKAEKGDA